MFQCSHLLCVFYTSDFHPYSGVMRKMLQKVVVCVCINVRYDNEKQRRCKYVFREQLFPNEAPTITRLQHCVCQEPLEPDATLPFTSVLCIACAVAQWSVDTRDS